MTDSALTSTYIMNLVTGYCTPCKNIQEAALVVQIEQTLNPEKDVNSILKMGKEAGVWYVVKLEKNNEN